MIEKCSPARLLQLVEACKDELVVLARDLRAWQHDQAAEQLSGWWQTWKWALEHWQPDAAPPSPALFVEVPAEVLEELTSIAKGCRVEAGYVEDGRAAQLDTAPTLLNLAERLEQLAAGRLRAALPAPEAPEVRDWVARTKQRHDGGVSWWSGLPDGQPNRSKQCNEWWTGWPCLATRMTEAEAWARAKQADPTTQDRWAEPAGTVTP